MRRRRLALLLIVAGVALLIVALLSGGGARGRRSGTHVTALAAGAGQRGSAVVGAGLGAPGSAPRGGPAAVAASARESAEVRALIALGKPIYCAGPRGDEVALTFDDGPGPYTRLVLDKLRKHHIHATFFVVARNIPLVPGATRRELEQGAVGDHTFTHPVLTELPPAEAEEEIVRAQVALERSSGGPVFLFRPPYEAHNATIDGIARAHGMLEILWTVDSQDSLGANWAQIERNVIAGLKPGAIILMHENHGQTVRALLGIFVAIERKHLRTVSVPQLLSDDPPSLAQVRAGGAACGVHTSSALSGS